MVEVLPRDVHNEQLVSNVHPPDWQNPQPAGRYNLVVVGAGTAGLISAIGTASMGGRVSLIERHLLGGDCLNVGCVPSKALIRAARAAHQVRTASDFGYELPEQGEVDFGAVMHRMRRLRASISPHDSAARFSDLGVDVFLGDANFTGPDTVEVAGETLRFTRAVIATGGRAAAPQIEGIEAAGFLTNESVFSLTELPRRLIVIGGGPIGCELAQAFRRFGSEVHLVQRRGELLVKEEPEAAAEVQRQFEAEGIRLHLGSDTIRAEKTADGKRLVIRTGGEEQAIDGDEILVAAGRTANTDGLGLDAAGVAFDRRGVSVDDRLQTTNPKIYAAGDVCSKYQFTHAADAMARICLRNALFPFGRQKVSALVIPKATYTDPEVASVGMTAHEAATAGIEIDSYRQEFSSMDRAILDGETDGFAVVHTRRGSDEIVGATIVAAHAGEMIGEITLLMTRGLGLGKLADVIHCYPTQVEVLKRIADAYSKTRFTPRVAKIFGKWLAWQR